MGTWTTTPSTAAAGGTITAALWNSDVRDLGNAFATAWTAYTPSLGNWTLGNGTAAGYYMRAGKLIIFKAQITFGSTSAAASNAPLIGLPVTAASSLPGHAAGRMYDDNLAASYDVAVSWTTTQAALYLRGTNGIYTAPSTTSPFTWATSDYIWVSGTYQAA